MKTATCCRKLVENCYQRLSKMNAVLVVKVKSRTHFAKDFEAIPTNGAACRWMALKTAWADMNPSRVGLIALG